jgi:1-acyl-sn-glycerol-3-phosphate acyltransferase
MRALAFNLAYWVLSALYAVLATTVLVLPGRKAVGWVIRRYARRMVQALRILAGIRLEVRGRGRVPEGACIIAAKHHSWFDGFCMYSQFDDVAFVTGDHLEKIPLLRGVLRKLGAIVVDNCGGHKARSALAESAAKAHADGRRILIYPEGHLSKPGERFRYKTGVYHMYAKFGLPVVPAATNLGLFAPQQNFAKHPGTAVLEFLEPIQPGLGRAEFMARLEQAIESRSQALIAEALREAPTASVLVPDPVRWLCSAHRRANRRLGGCRAWPSTLRRRESAPSASGCSAPA